MEFLYPDEDSKNFLLKLKKNRSLNQAVQRGILGARRLIKELEDQEVPINLLNYAHYLEAEIVYSNSLVSRCGVEGLTIDLMQFIESDEGVRRFVSGKNGCKYIVVVDSSINDTRKRFVIAHELGHIYLRHIDIREKMKIRLELLKQNAVETGSFQEYYREKRNADRILKMHEVAANAFAGELLVPSSVLKHCVCCKKIRDLSTLAEMFLASHYVVLVQLCYLDLLDAVEYICVETNCI